MNDTTTFETSISEVDLVHGRQRERLEQEMQTGETQFERIVLLAKRAQQGGLKPERRSTRRRGQQALADVFAERGLTLKEVPSDFAEDVEMACIDRVRTAAGLLGQPVMVRDDTSGELVQAVWPSGEKRVYGPWTFEPSEVRVPGAYARLKGAWIVKGITLTVDTADEQSHHIVAVVAYQDFGRDDAGRRQITVHGWAVVPAAGRKLIPAGDMAALDEANDMAKRVCMELRELAQREAAPGAQDTTTELESRL